ncbi:EamA family transporter RarD [Snodgrassella sp. CFCC 13594]|uniref:EamA family transporter RarD n=1 Tax=Snodgrassella sp. CFCC 13594 TaxID=1775559 RepID=UPI00082C67B6|nr:EamA family transporter RarD [Snodgrassella sp. CFCC 13594]
MNTHKKGIWAALLSNFLFGAMFLYSDWMAPMSGTTVFAWRMVSMLLSLWLIVLCTHGWPELFRFVYQVGMNGRKWLLILLPTPIIGYQLWLFMWAPVNGHGIDVAMGYFLFPLMMVLCGWLFLHEELSGWQWLAVGLAGMGVAHELWQNQVFSWVTLSVFTTYPLYYMLRRWMQVPALTGLLIDLTLIAPVAAFYLAFQPGSWAILTEPSRYWLLIPVMGIISAASMQLNLYASRMIPMSLFGMFSYLEPILLFVLTVTVLQTPVTVSAMITYSLIWVGLCFAMYDSYLKTQQANLARGKPSSAQA